MRLGEVPHKRHTQFRQPDGSLYAEQLFSTEGFSSNYSLLYHCHPPTEILRVGEAKDVRPKRAADQTLKPRSLESFHVKPQADFMDSRTYLLINDDLLLGVAAPQESMQTYFYKNADADEMLFIHEGKGVFETAYGSIPFSYGDYLVIPRGTIYQITFETKENRMLFLESYSPIRYPRRYLSHYGQLMEHAPFCERDIRGPQDLKTHNIEGEFLIQVKKDGLLHPITYKHHPFDVIGWDGYEYPFAFSIHDFEPITGRVHQPPPVHQTFETKSFVVCSFVPRLYDYHPLSIPAPYHHSNIDSDEILYYVDGDFMSRKHVTRGMISVHPAGIPHGPHPGTVEKSIGAKETRELAVMVDTFRRLYVTEAALQVEDPNYMRSWVE